MLPQTEYPITTPESCEYAGDYCEESRCNQLETAEQVYRRIVERLQRPSTDPHLSDEATLKKIWLASFTGSNIYYSA